MIDFKKLIGSWRSLIVVGILLGITILAIWWFVFESPKRLKDENVRIEAEAAIAEGDAVAATHAINQISDLEERQQLRNELERKAHAAIKDDTPVNDDTYFAIMRELCKSASYRNDERCIPLH